MSTVVSYPVIVEFSGLPGGGKTSTIDILEHYFCREGFEVQVVKEGSSRCPISRKSRIEFVTWTANQIINTLLELRHCDRTHGLVFVDRGVFDSQAFVRLLCRTSELSEAHKRALVDYVDLPYWGGLADIVFLLDISSRTSCYRHGRDRLSDKPGIIVNSTTLESLRECYEDVFNFSAARSSSHRVERVDAEERNPVQIAELCRSKIESMLAVR